MTRWTSPGRDFVDEEPFSTRIGVITYVDEINLKADVRILTGGGDRYEIDLTQAMCGPRSFWGGVPEVNSVVVIGYRRRSKHLQEAVILGYIPTGNKTGMRFDPFATAAPGEIDPEDQELYESIYGKPFRYKRLKLRSGEVGGMSSQGAELVLSKDIRMVNRAGDSIELRDAERSLITQTIHRVESDSAIYRLSGPIRRGGLNLPPDIFRAPTGPTLPPGVAQPPPDPLILKDASDPERYFGRDELQDPTAGLADTSGTILSRVNSADFPPATLASGKQYFYVSGNPGTNPEDPDNGGTGRAYTEYRMEIRHDTELQQEVRDEIDGFSMDRPAIFIEQVYGTLVGNDPWTTMGQRQYAQILKPCIFDDFQQTNPARFRLETIDRSPVNFDESNTAAGAYLFKIQPPAASSTSPFAVAVQKQGKLLVNVPGSTVETDPSAKNISAELNFDGAVKARFGAAKPDGISLHAAFEGGLYCDFGTDSDGNSLNLIYRGGVKTEYRGPPNEDGVSQSEAVLGNAEKHVRGGYSILVNGKCTIKSTQLELRATNVSITGISGTSEISGGKSVTVTGKSQFNYALLVLENIAAGGRVSNIVAGGAVNNILAGAFTQTVAAGVSTFANPGGAFNITVGTGAFTATTAAGAVTITAGSGALSLTAGAGAVAITAGLAMNLTATTAISLVSPQILLGGPAAVLGVSRGAPMLPINTPSLDWITGAPLQGSAVIRSI